MSVAVCLLMLVGSGCDSVGPTADATAVDEYLASCPEVPVFNRNLDLVSDDEAYPTPEAAVLDVAGRGIEVVDVLTTSPGGRDVEVRAGQASGRFTLRRRDAGWLIQGGEGCAAWPAARVVLDDEDDPEGEGAGGETSISALTRRDRSAIHRLFDRWTADSKARDFEAMCVAQTASFNADLVDHVAEEVEDRGVTCETAVSRLTARSGRPGAPLIEVQAIDGGYDAMAHGRQGASDWLFAREGDAWKIAYVEYSS